MPRTIHDTKRTPLSIRTTSVLRDQLEHAAKASGRALATEIEHRLERSVAQDEQLGGPELRPVFYAMASSFALSGQFSAGPDVPAKEWLRGPAAITAIASVVDTLADLLQLGDKEVEQLSQVVTGRLATRRAMRRARK